MRADGTAPSPYSPLMTGENAGRALPHRRIMAATSASVDRATHAERPAIEHVRVDHGRRHVAMPEQLLDRTDVVAGLEQRRRERMAKAVARRGFGEPRGASGCAEGFLQHGFVEVVAVEQA